VFVLLEHFKKYEETIQLNQLSSTCNNRQIHKFIPEFFSLQQRKKLVDLQKEAISTQKQPSCKKRCSPGQGEKSCEMQVAAAKKLLWR